MAKTTIELDSALLKKAMRLAKGLTKKQVIDEALAVYTRRLGQKDFIDRLVAGKIKWRMSGEAVERFWINRGRSPAEAKRLTYGIQRPSRKAA